jgi:hypothetical protein
MFDYCSANHPYIKGYNDKFGLEAYLVEPEKRILLNEVFSALKAVDEPTLNKRCFPCTSIAEKKGFSRCILELFRV